MKSLGGENNWRNRVHLTLKQQHSTLLSKTELYCSVLISQVNCCQLNLSSLFCVYQWKYQWKKVRGEKKITEQGKTRKIHLLVYWKTTTIIDIKSPIFKASPPLTAATAFCKGKSACYVMRKGTAFLKDQFGTAGKVAKAICISKQGKN